MKRNITKAAMENLLAKGVIGAVPLTPVVESSASAQPSVTLWDELIEPCPPTTTLVDELFPPTTTLGHSSESPLSR
jgi:hypothetical protein